MEASIHDERLRLKDAEALLALGVGGLLLSVGAVRRSRTGALLALASAPLLYRGFTGQWPSARARNGSDTRAVLGGHRGVHVRESVQVEMPVADVYAFWRRLDRLPQFMTHLDSVTELPERRSSWVAVGPGGLRVEWTAELINEIENELLAWQSLPGSDIVSAGSVRFKPVRGGRGTQVHVHLQYDSPAGKPGALAAWLVGQEPSQTIREDLRRFKQLLEAHEVPRATPSA